MDTIFMNSENRKIFDPHRLLLNLSGKINLKGSDKYVAISNLSIYCTCTSIKSHTKIVNLKYQLRRGTKNSNYLMNHVLYQIFKTILNISLKSMNK